MWSVVHQQLILRQHLLHLQLLLIHQHIFVHLQLLIAYMSQSLICSAFVCALCVARFLVVVKHIDWLSLLHQLDLAFFPPKIEARDGTPKHHKALSAVSHPSLQSCALVAANGSWGNTTDSALRAPGHAARYNPCPLVYHHHILHCKHRFR